jgi:hypothetical protein
MSSEVVTTQEKILNYICLIQKQILIILYNNEYKKYN